MPRKYKKPPEWISRGLGIFFGVLLASGLVVASSAANALGAEQDQTTLTPSAEEETTAEAIQMDLAEQGAGAAASDPLAKVNHTDLKWTYFRLNDPNDSRLNDYWIKGAWMFAPGLSSTTSSITRRPM